jgi:hypothetical protein
MPNPQLLRKFRRRNCRLRLTDPLLCWYYYRSKGLELTVSDVRISEEFSVKRNGKLRLSGVRVAHAYNPGYLGGRDQEDCGLKPAWGNSS